MSMRGQRGEGKVGCLIMIAIAVVVGFILAKTIPVYLDKLDFEDQLEKVASEAGARNYPVETIQERVIELCKVKEFDASKEDIHVEKTGGNRPGGEVRIDIKYQRTVDYSGYYTYTFQFHSRVSSFVGAL
jgi:hypothetical protein